MITNAEQRDAVLESCPQLLPERVIGEPQGRDTAAAVGLAALVVERAEPGAAFALLPADHVIADAAGFCSVLEGAFEAAEAEDYLVTIGIQPDFPSTGYGYLKRGPSAQENGSRPVYRWNGLWRNQILRKQNNILKKADFIGMRECLSGGLKLFSLRLNNTHRNFHPDWRSYHLPGMLQVLWEMP